MQAQLSMSSAEETTIELRPGPAPGDEDVEVVERKGVGHPDTICDALAERAAVALARAYRERFGTILHHNVDKALLVGGASRPAFGGGEVTAPIEIDLAGRATRGTAGVELPIEEIVREAAVAFLRDTFHALDPDRHVVLRSRLRVGSSDLRALFASEGEGTMPRANDTSIGVGFAPTTLTERIVLRADAALRGASRARGTAFVGEDVKILAVRRRRQLSLTIGCALVDRALRDLDDYAAAKAQIATLARRAAEAEGATALDALEVVVNAADDISRGDVYLTVTGTSAEAGDDGEVGRGNRVGGLITPGRPMTLEAAAGKNAVTHVGKLYGVLAREIARDVVDSIPSVVAADAVLVSRIGAAIDAPALVHLRVLPRVGTPLDARAREEVRAVAARALVGARSLSARILEGEFALFSIALLGLLLCSLLSTSA
jgi:S-adenosylmethionine synthetase